MLNVLIAHRLFHTDRNSNMKPSSMHLLAVSVMTIATINHHLVDAQQTATTTRYWDCSGGSCACSYLPFANDASRVSHCYTNGLFAAPGGNPHGAKFYGSAAISEALGGTGWLGPGCGKCWKVLYW